MPSFRSLGDYRCHLFAGDKFYVPALGTQIEEVFSTHDTWSTQALRDKMVRLHGIGVLQTKAGCLLVLNDRRMTPEKLQDLTFCRQLIHGILYAAAHCSWFKSAAWHCVTLLVSPHVKHKSVTFCCPILTLTLCLYSSGYLLHCRSASPSTQSLLVLQSRRARGCWFL